MRINSDLYRVCGIVDKKEFAWIPFTNHKLVDYRIEPPSYRLFVDVHGVVLEFIQPMELNLDHLRQQIEEHLEQKKQIRSRVRIIGQNSTT